MSFVHRPVAPHPRFVCVSRRRYRGEGLGSGNILLHHLEKAAKTAYGRDVGVNYMIAARKVA